MANQKLKIDQLAKLRQYKAGDDVSQFMSTQFRQIIRALEQAYIPTAGRADFYATNTSAFSVGVIPFADQLAISGTSYSNAFYPSEAGKYWVEFGMAMGPNTVPSSNSLVLKKGSAVIHTLNATFTVGGLKYVSGKCFIDLTPSSGAFFEFQGQSDTGGQNFYCSFLKVS